MTVERVVLVVRVPHIRFPQLRATYDESEDPTAMAMRKMLVRNWQWHARPPQSQVSKRVISYLRPSNTLRLYV